MMQSPSWLVLRAGGWCIVGIIFFVVPAWSLDVPPLTSRVVDQAHVISSTDRSRLTSLLTSHESKTSNQVVILTLPTLEGEPLAPFTHRVASEWKLGQKGTDNGVLFLIAIQERKIRIEVGYGLEGTLTDAKSSQIIRHEIVPRFRAGDFSGGIVAGTQAILGTIEGTYVAPSSANPTEAQGLGLWDSFIIAVMLGTFIGLFLGSRKKFNGSVIGMVISFFIAVPAALWLGLLAGVATSLLVSVFNIAGRGSSQDGVLGDSGMGWPGHSWPIGRSGGFGGGFGGSGGFGGGGGSFGGGGASGGW